MEGRHLAHYTPQNYKIRVQTWKSVSPRERSQGVTPHSTAATFCAQGDRFAVGQAVGITCVLSPGDPGCGSGHDFRRAARGGPSATLRGRRTAAGPLWEPPMILQAGFTFTLMGLAGRSPLTPVKARVRGRGKVALVSVEPGRHPCRGVLGW